MYTKNAHECYIAWRHRPTHHDPYQELYLALIFFIRWKTHEVSTKGPLTLSEVKGYLCSDLERKYLYLLDMICRPYLYNYIY